MGINIRETRSTPQFQHTQAPCTRFLCQSLIPLRCENTLSLAEQPDCVISFCPRLPCVFALAMPSPLALKPDRD